MGVWHISDQQCVLYCTVYLPTIPLLTNGLNFPDVLIVLAIINSLLTAIGGGTPNDEATNSLLSTDDKWTEKFPPMPTKRYLTAAVCSGRSLVVAGGCSRVEKKLVIMSTVEVMDTETLQWSTASSLPHPLHQASATLCGDQVYLLAGFNYNNTSSRSVFSCSLPALLLSCQQQSLIARLKSFS